MRTTQYRSPLMLCQFVHRVTLRHNQNIQLTLRIHKPWLFVCPLNASPVQPTLHLPVEMSVLSNLLSKESSFVAHASHVMWNLCFLKLVHDLGITKVAEVLDLSSLQWMLHFGTQEPLDTVSGASSSARKSSKKKVSGYPPSSTLSSIITAASETCWRLSSS